MCGYTAVPKTDVLLVCSVACASAVYSFVVAAAAVLSIAC